VGCPCIMGNHDLEVINPDLVHEDASVSPWELELINQKLTSVLFAPLSRGLRFHWTPRLP
jgi:hypothetical protein